MVEFLAQNWEGLAAMMAAAGTVYVGWQNMRIRRQAANVSAASDAINMYAALCTSLQKEIEKYDAKIRWAEERADRLEQKLAQAKAEHAAQIAELTRRWQEACQEVSQLKRENAVLRAQLARLESYRSGDGQE